MKTKLTITVIAIFIIGAVWILVAQKDAIDPVNTRGPVGAQQAATSTSSSTTGVSLQKSYTLADVATHSTRASCWTTINGKVYDVTSWISRHPGGADAILSLCGKDGSSAFDDQHGGDKRPASELATFIIGTLAK